MVYGHGCNNEARWGVARLVRAMAFHVVPLVDRELAKWVGVLERCPDPELKKQGLASIRHKRFHAIGGSVYGIDPQPQVGLVSLIVAYQTISDYLDNLCDRAGVEDERAFRRLHQAMLDAVTPMGRRNAGRGGPGQLDYYAFYPHKSDGGYLQVLVAECKRQISLLPSYGAARDTVERFARLYGDLQVYKHVRKQDRVPLLTAWFEREWRGSDDVYWWEFAAACGSTLGIFALLGLAARQDFTADLAMRVSSAYFPWICGLHVLLDYLIDQSEDTREGDLNFVSFYRDPGESARRLDYFLEKALRGASDLPRAEFHQGVVKGLLALYLSDPKVEGGALGAIAAPLLERAGPDSRAMWRACRFLRRVGLL
ncbi:MAG: tetraprenyl-beta-curcumene synthase family protein [Bacillota bacterium]